MDVEFGYRAAMGKILALPSIESAIAIGENDTESVQKSRKPFSGIPSKSVVVGFWFPPES